MHTLLDNQSLDNGVWKPRPDLDDNYLYRERIMAGYISGNFDLGNFNVIAGIRIENTDVKPHSNIRPDESRYQKYTDLFPTLRAMYFINRNRGHMINLGYNRYIRRPGFSELNPYRIQIDNYTYFIGNPDMKPSYTETISLAGIVAHKYSLTLSYDDMKDDVAQVILQDPTNPEVLYYQYANIDRIKRYTAALSLPLNIYGWWRMGVDGVYFYSENRIKTRSIDGGTFQGRLNNLFTLPGNWVIEANYMYLSGIIQGTMRAKSLDSFDVSLKKGFFDNKFTVSIFTNNIFDNGKWTLRYSTEEPGNFIKTARAHQGRSARTYGMTLRWNFRAGKEVKIQKVQSGNYEERAR